MIVNKMSSGKSANSSHELPRPSSRQWLQAILIGATLLLAGKWAASQYPNGWTNDLVLDYANSTVEGQNAEPYSSTLTEPWCHVSEVADIFCCHTCCPQIDLHNRYNVVFVVINVLHRSLRAKNLHTMTVSTVSNALAWIYQWIGTIRSPEILALGSQ